MVKRGFAYQGHVSTSRFRIETITRTDSRAVVPSSLAIVPLASKVRAEKARSSCEGKSMVRPLIFDESETCSPVRAAGLSCQGVGSFAVAALAPVL